MYGRTEVISGNSVWMDEKSRQSPAIIDKILIESQIIFVCPLLDGRTITLCGKFLTSITTKNGQFSELWLTHSTYTHHSLTVVTGTDPRRPVTVPAPGAVGVGLDATRTRNSIEDQDTAVRPRGGHSNMHPCCVEKKGPRMRVLLLLGCFTALASSSSASCRHSNYTDTTSPNRMKLGLYGVDNASWSTAANGDVANIDSCPTWAASGGGFYHSASTCQSVAMVLITGRTTSVQVVSHSFAPTYAPSNTSNNVPSIYSLRDPLSSTTSVDLMITNTVPTSLSLWPLVFLCAASQSLGVWRPAIGLLLVLGLPQTEVGAAPPRFPAELSLTSDDETAGEDSTQLPEQQQLFGYNINQRRSGDSSSELVHRARSPHCLNILP